MRKKFPSSRKRRFVNRNKSGDIGSVDLVTDRSSYTNRLIHNLFIEGLTRGTNVSEERLGKGVSSVSFQIFV